MTGSEKGNFRSAWSLSRYLKQEESRMTPTVLPEGTVVNNDTPYRFNWSAVIAGSAVAAATIFFLITLGAGFGLALGGGGAVFFSLGAIYVLAAQAFGFAAGGHVAGRLIGPAIESKKEEEYRAGAHGLVVWAITVVASLAIVALVAAAGMGNLHGNSARSDSSISAYWADILLRPDSDHALAHGEELTHDKTEAARILAADLHPGAMARDDNRADLIRLTVLDAGLSRGEAIDRVNMVESRMRQELDAARKVAGYASLWTAFALLFGAVLAVTAAISARWEDDKIHFSWARRY
jgi:hypothetical protein